MSKAVIVTGSEGGIGQAICHAFKRNGYFVVGFDLEQKGSACDRFVKVDLNKMCVDEVYCESIIGQLRTCLNGQSLHVLVNNAAVQIIKDMEDLSVDDWNRTLHVNVVGPFLLVQKLEFAESEGSVVNIGSIHANLTKPKFICYATSKAALCALTRSMALELGSRLRVNAINPACTETSMLVEGFKERPKLLEKLKEISPMSRIAKPEEIAAVAVFLASHDASYITGACINVDGAFSTRLHDPM